MGHTVREENYNVRMNARPLAVTILGWVYIVAGIGGLVWHAGEFKMGDLLEVDVIESVSVQVAGVVAGIFMLRGKNWARWLAIAWIAGHVVLSAFFAFAQLAVHCVIAAGFIYLLVRQDAARYFGSKAAG